MKAGELQKHHGITKGINKRKKLRLYINLIYIIVILPLWSNTDLCRLQVIVANLTFLSFSFVDSMVSSHSLWNHPVFSLKEYFFPPTGWYSVMKFNPLRFARRTSQFSSPKISILCQSQQEKKTWSIKLT